MTESQSPDRWADLGEFIRQQRNTARLSLRRLSEIAGISNPYLSQIERGLRKPSAEILQQIAKALRISAETLYVRAGILEDERRDDDLVRHILTDPCLVEEQRQALVRVYLSFRRENGLWEADHDHGSPRCSKRPGPDREALSVGWPSMRRLAVLSMHTSPLAQPGTGDGGGMNVYVRELSVRPRPPWRDLRRLHEALVERSARRRRRRTGFCRPPRRSWPSGHRRQGDSARPRGGVHRIGDRPHDGTAPCRSRCRARRRRTAIHANYWLSGLAGHAIKHRLGLPLVSTFHTLDRVKAEASPEEVESAEPGRRARAESEIIGCSDALLASCPVEVDQLVELYGAEPDRVEIVPLGVDHAFFSPGDRAHARRALGLAGQGPLLLFVGRIQPLKGADVAVKAFELLS